jgi:dephospho-CoA kinase
MSPDFAAREGKRPLVVGLTGSIGSGKSHVRSTLVSLGAEGIDADRVAHEVMAPGGSAYPAIIAEFDRDILTADGTIDRGRLGARVFGDAASLARLEAIIHPAVYAVTQAHVAASTAAMVVIEAIKLLEAGFGRTLCDRVWVAACSRRQQLARLKHSRGMPSEEARRRINHQMSLAQMAAQADRVIDTGGTMAETALKVLAAWVELGLPLPALQVRQAAIDDAEGIAAVLNSIMREGGRTVADRTYTPAQERAFLRRLPRRSFLMVALLGKVIAGFQVVEPYATYTDAMDHVASLGTCVVAPARGRGFGRAMSRSTFAAARATGFSKLVIQVRSDNPDAQMFYMALGFKPCGRLSRQAFVDGRYVDELLYELFLDEVHDG